MLNPKLSSLLGRFSVEIWPRIEADYRSGMFRNETLWSWGRNDGPTLPKKSEVGVGGIWLGGVLMESYVPTNGRWGVTISRQIEDTSNDHQIYLERDEKNGTISFIGSPIPSISAAEDLLQCVVDRWHEFVPGGSVSQLVLKDK